MEDEYNSGDKAKATHITKQLVIASPKFHLWGGLHDHSGVTRKIEGFKRPPKQSYKAVIYFYMESGAKSFNMIVPWKNCREKNLFNEYKKAWGKLALPESKLLQSDTVGSDQQCLGNS